MSVRAVRALFEEALDAAFAVGRLERVEEILAELEAEPPAQRPPHMRATEARFRPKLAAARDGDAEAVERDFTEAERHLREVAKPFPLAVALTEHAEWLAATGRAEDRSGVAAEARAILERLEATPWLQRLSVAPAAAAAVS